MSRCMILLVLGAVACTPRPNLDAERAAIAHTDTLWLDALQAGAVDSAVSFWSEDAHVIGPGQAPLVGRAAIRQMLVDNLRIPGFSVTWATTEIVVAPSGDIAYSFGTNVFTIPVAAGTLDTLRGQGLVVWRKEADSRWRCVVDMWTPESE